MTDQFNANCDGVLGKDEIICEWVFPRYREKVFALRTRRYWLVYLGADQGSELYDHDQDPHEMRNVFDDPEYSSIRAQLLERMIIHIGRFQYHASPIEERRIQEHLLLQVTLKSHRKGLKWGSVHPSLLTDNVYHQREAALDEISKRGGRY